MRPEKEIQSWLEELVKEVRPGAPTLCSVLRYDDSPLSVQMRACVNYTRSPEDFDVPNHRSVQQACRVLRALVEPRFRSADKNISQTPGVTLKPDLVLEDVISGALVLIELKRERTAARQFATELLAYANYLINQHPGSKIFVILVSTTWTALERLAFAELAHGPHPALALEYREEGQLNTSPTLWVRSDLLPVANVAPFHARALEVHTKTFFLPAHWDRWAAKTAPWLNRMEHAVAALVRSAEKERTSGFVLIWSHPHELPSQGHEGATVHLYVSMAVRNPCRVQELPEFDNDEAALDFAWSNDEEVLSNDAAVRHLLRFELDPHLRSYSSEHEGSWDDLQARLEREGASVQHFAAFGEIGDHIAAWRTHQRRALYPLIPDITAFPAWHPLTWLLPLESLIDSRDQENGDPLAWHGFHCGKDLARYAVRPWAPRTVRNFLDATVQARFAKTWCDRFAHQPDAPSLPIHLSAQGLHSKAYSLEPAIEFALACVAEAGALARYCFALGYHVGSGRDNVEHLVTARRQLQDAKLRLPRKLNELADKVENEFNRHSSPWSATQW